MGTEEIGGLGNLEQAMLHRELPRRRTYVHPNRWTSLGLSLVEAMHLGMPVVAVASTEVVDAVPPDAGVVSTRVDTLVDAVRRFRADADLAEACGRAARRHALRAFGLTRFLDDWEALLAEVVR
jgi:glycosyltransferase involved in cell wall biosynthesis